MPNKSLPSDSRHYTNVVGVLILPQVLVAGFAAFYTWFLGMHSVGCSTQCDHATEYAASLVLLGALAAITILTLAGLIVWRRRGWRTWPITLGGVLLTIVVTVVVDRVIAAAYA